MNTTRPHSLFSTTRLARAARRTTALLLAGAALAIAPLDSRAASATPPDLMAYQGFLVDANGNPLAPTTPLNYPAIFRIYTASQGGTRLWSEQQIVTVDKGNFSVLLGQGTQYASETRPALSSVMGGADASDLYVGVTVTIDGNSAEILPRLRLMTSPYAFLATRAASLVQPNGTPVISYSGGQIQLSGGVNVSGTVTGNGSGLTGLTSAQIPTTLSGDRAFTGNLLMNNAAILQARNAAGAYENVFWPRWSDNMTYLNFGTGGFNIRNNASNPVMFMQNGGNVGIGTTAPGTTLDIASTTTWRPLGVRGNGGTDMVVMGNLSNRATIGAHNSAGSAWANLAINPGGGAVGIGTSTPAATLHTLSSSFNAGLIESSSTIGTWDVLRNTSVGGRSWQLISTGSGNGEGAGKLLFNNGANPFGADVNALTLQADGKVGIGTSFPNAKLAVSGFASTALGVNGYFWRTGVIPNVAAGTFNLSIYADQDIAGQVFRAWSDERIKRIEGRSDTSSDLATLLDIEVTDYTYIDTVAKGSGRQKKVVAQQVEKVFPQAVNQLTDIVPDIYEQAIVTNGWVQLATDLKLGERVRLIGEKESGIHEVLEVRESAFRTSFQPTTEKVFVFGREVKDFRSVDYDALAMLNVSATQELAKQIRELKVSQERLATLEAKANKLEKVEAELLEVRAKLASQQAVNARWESRFEALEKHLAMQPATTNASVSGETSVAAR